MSTIKVDTIQNTSGVQQYLAKAWVNFNGTGTVAIRASGNVSSITDRASGKYTVNYSQTMPDANYSYSACGKDGSTNAAAVICLDPQASPASTSTQIVTIIPNVVTRDNEFSMFSAHR